MAITEARIVRYSAVEYKLNVRLPEDYQEFLEKDKGYFDREKFAVYGYDGEMSHNDLRCVIRRTMDFREEFPEAPQSYVVISHDKLNDFPLVLDTEKKRVYSFRDGKKGKCHGSFEEWLNVQFMDSKERGWYENSRPRAGFEPLSPYSSTKLKHVIPPEITLQHEQIKVTRDLKNSVDRAGTDTIDAIYTTGDRTKGAIVEVGTGIKNAIVKKGEDTEASIKELADKTSKAIEQHRQDSIDTIRETAQQKIDTLEQARDALVANINQAGADNVAAVNAANKSSTEGVNKSIKYGALIAFVAAIVGAVVGTALTLHFTPASNQLSTQGQSVQQAPQPTGQALPPAQKAPQKTTP